MMTEAAMMVKVTAAKQDAFVFPLLCRLENQIFHCGTLKALMVMNRAICVVSNMSTVAF